MSESFLKGRVLLHCGDCLDVLASLGENSVDSCVTDPPYHLTSIVKRFANAKSENESFANNNPSKRFGALSKGFMSKTWDGGDIAFGPATWAAVLRVLKPGAHLLAMGGTRTYHRLACAIEDAGFEIRDSIQWLYGSGFPKSHDVSKGIDRAAGAERKVGGEGPYSARRPQLNVEAKNTYSDGVGDYGSSLVTIPATAAARQWEGWGTALKPACEMIVLARKPLSEKTVAANILKWGCGALNISGCRVHADDAEEGRLRHGGGQNYTPVPDSDPSCRTFGRLRPDVTPASPAGRWPANCLHDGSAEVLAAFPDARSGGHINTSETTNPRSNSFGDRTLTWAQPGENTYSDSGSAARFFYTAKADGDDRLGSKHPTVKPLDLMQYLVRLITPPKGLVLDPFAGTGTTGEAAFREGFNAVLIEREAEYQDDIRRRMKLVLSGPDERAREAIKERMKGKPVDHGPLFAEAAE